MFLIDGFAFLITLFFSADASTDREERTLLQQARTIDGAPPLDAFVI